MPSPARISTPPVTTHQPASHGTVQLATTVSANSWNGSQGGWVAFQVDDTGSAAAGQITVAITLPAGASMTGGDGGGGGGGGEASLRSFTGHDAHWNCQPTSTGATCTLASLAAGNKAAGGIYFTVSGGSVCGQPVDLTAVSGSVSSSAQSSVTC